MSNRKVALQLYTVRDETQRDFAATLQRVAALGYTAVEFAGYGGLSAIAMRTLLDETGLQPVSTHISLYDLLDDRLTASLAYCHTIGCPTMILPWIAPEWSELDHMHVLAPRLNQIGQRCRDEGITFGYHNHDFEFTEIDGHTWLDHLLHTTDPALLKIELDIYWAAHSDHDPLALLQRLGERVALIHLKDMTADKQMTEVGHGTLPMRALIDFAQAHNIWSVIEHDEPTIPSLESARLSLQYFLHTSVDPQPALTPFDTPLPPIDMPRSER